MESLVAVTGVIDDICFQSKIVSKPEYRLRRGDENGRSNQTSQCSKFSSKRGSYSP